MAAEWILKDFVQLKAVQIKLTAAHTEILFTYYSAMLFKSIFSFCV